MLLPVFCVVEPVGAVVLGGGGGGDEVVVVGLELVDEGRGRTVSGSVEESVVHAVKRKAAAATPVSE